MLIMLSLLSQETIAGHEVRILSSSQRRARSPSASASTILLPTMRSLLSLCVLARRAALSAAKGGDAHSSDGRRRCGQRRCQCARSAHRQRLDAAAAESVSAANRVPRCVYVVLVHVSVRGVMG